MAERRRLIAANNQQQYYDEDYKPPLKKRKGGCLKAFIITLCVTLGTLILLIGGGLIAGNIVLHNMFGVSLFDTFGAIMDFGNYDEKKIVTNPYDDEDATEFYKDLSGTLYLNEDVLNSDYIQSLVGDATSGDTDGLMSALTSIITKDNFDSELLQQYVGWQDGVPESGKVKMTDRELGAFINDVVLDSGMLDNYMTEDIKKMIGGKSMSEFITFNQLVIEGGTELTSKELNSDVAETMTVNTEDVYLTMTASLYIEKLMDAMVPYLEEMTGAPIGIGMWFAKLFTPEKTFFSVTVNLRDSSYGVDLLVNSLDEETVTMTAPETILNKYKDADGKVTKMERIYILIEAFSGIDLNQLLQDSIKGVLPFICETEESEYSLAKAIDFGTLTKTEEGMSFELEAFSMLAGMLNQSTGGNATEADIIILMQALVCTESEDAYNGAEDFDYRTDIYYDPTSYDMAVALKTLEKELQENDPDRKINSIYDVKTEAEYNRLFEIYGDIGYKTLATEIDESWVNIYEEEFMTALENTYCLELKDPDTGKKYTFSDIADIFGLSSSGSNTDTQKLANLINGAALEDIAAGEDKYLYVTDRMLGAIFQALIDQLVPEDFKQYGMEIRTLKIDKEAVNSVEHDMVSIVFTISLAGLENVNEYVASFIPEELALGITVDLTPGMAAEDKIAASIACYNGVTKQGDITVLNGLTSDRIITAVKAVLGSNFDIDGLLSSMDTTLNDVIANMTTVMPNFRFVNSNLNTGHYDAEFPTIFEIAAQQLGLLTDDEETSVTGDELKGIVNYLNNYKSDVEYTEADYLAFMQSLQQNYYIDVPLTTFNSLFDTFASGFNSDLLRLGEAKQYSYGVDGQTQNAYYYMGMLYDTRAASELKVKLTETDLLAIMREWIAGGGYETISDFAKVLKADITSDGKLELYLAADIKDMLSGSMNSLFTAKSIYITVTVDMTSVIKYSDAATGETYSYYDTTIAINGQTAGNKDYVATMKLLRLLNVESFDIDSLARVAGKAVYDGLKTMSDAHVTWTFEDGAIVLPDFYSYVMTLMQIDSSTCTPDDLKAAVQGMQLEAVNTESIKYYVNTDGTEIDNVYNFNPDSVITNKVADSVADSFDVSNDIKIDGSSQTATVSDQKFGAFLKEKMAEDENYAALGELVQLSAIPANASTAGTQAAYAFANSYDNTLSGTEPYLMFTFRASLADLISSADMGSDTLKSILPEEIYMTILFDIDVDSGSLVVKYVRVNNLTKTLTDVLMNKIFGSGDTDNSLEQAGKVVDLMDGYIDDKFAVEARTDGGDTACGNIKVSAASFGTGAGGIVPTNYIDAQAA